VVVAWRARMAVSSFVLSMIIKSSSLYSTSSKKSSSSEEAGGGKAILSPYLAHG
jgi:hypothetical protein